MTVTWGRVRGEAIAHAFGDGPGWTRSICRAVPWQSALELVGSTGALCTGCADALVAIEREDKNLPSAKASAPMAS